ncbi:MAG TPA: ABC transporter permease [Vicinamibacteria bacterium]|nr:ABC transporter permease [Vicinamibacteria bacterium]
MLQNVLRDARIALRVFASSPGVTLVAALTLALGIAVASTVFSWIDGVLLHSYPGVTDTRGLALVQTNVSSGASSYLDYRDYREALKGVGETAVGRLTPLSIGADGNAERAWAELVSANYFDVLRVKPVLGRAFLPEEGADRPGAFPVAVISHRLWQGRYRGDPGVLGTTVRLNRHLLTIVGVAPPRFRGSMVGFAYDVWMPITMAREMGTGDGTLSFRGCRDLTSVLVRLAPGATTEQARAEASAVARRLAASYPDTNRGVEATVVPVWAGQLGAQGMLMRPLAILAAVSALLLLIVCANVANLLLSRAVARQKELAIRVAHGASRGRLVQQLLTETLLLATAGGALGLLLVCWTGRSLDRLLPPLDFPIDIGGGLSGRTVGFTLLLVLAATVASGLVPALVSVRGDLSRTLNEGGRGGIGGARSHRLRKLLVGAEVGLAVVAVIGALLFLRSFRNANRIEPGFDARNVLVAQFYLSNAGYSAQEQWAFCRTLRERMEQVPGVVGATYTDFVPLSSPASSPEDYLPVDGYVPAPNERMRLPRAAVPPGFFQFMGIPLVEGREFSERDEAGAPAVLIVNQTFARRFFGGASPIGRTVAGGAGTIVGLVRDGKYDTPTERPQPYFYRPFRQEFAPGLNFAFLVRTRGDPTLVVPELRRQALALNQDAVFHSVRLRDAIGYSLYVPMVTASLLSVVGAVCLLLATAGLYSVISCAVSQRVQEFGVRMALGAGPWDLVRMVTRESLLLAVPGVLVGMAVALAAARAVGGMLVGVSAADPATFAGAALFLLLVSLLASYWPARRAARVDAMSAMRSQ